MPGYSIGAVYASIANLPRDLLFKKKLTTLVCIILGPTEPSLCYLNRVLEPLVQDIRFCERGFDLSIRGATQRVCARVLFAACDLPAQRKLVGSVSYNHNRHPCAYCGVSKAQINHESGYDPDGLPPKEHTRDELLQAAFRYESANLAEKRIIEKTYGVPFSVFMRLPAWISPQPHLWTLYTTHFSGL
jgi:hypothetical protein